jgi:flagellin-like protein
MNYMKKIRKLKRNSKALSPVVASIILIAVTVAVSVVVAAWMGGMTIGLMGSAEQVSITNVAFTASTGTGVNDTIQVMVQNSGGNQASITTAFINGVLVTGGNITPAAPISLSKSTSTTITLSAGPANTLVAGNAYTIKLITAKGTSVVSAATTFSG